MWATEYTVTYTPTSSSAISASGTAPTGSTATLTGNSGWQSPMLQLTYGKNAVLTLTGYEGCTITGFKMSMKSNSSKGKGSMTLVAGTTTLHSVPDAAFNSSDWYGSWSTSAVDVNFTSVMTTDYTVDEDENIVITVTNHGTSNATNSLYIGSYTITYEVSGGDPTPVLQSVAVSGTPTTKTYEEGNVFDVAGLVVTGTYDVGDPAAISEGITWKARTNELSDDAVALANYTLTKGQTSMQVQATVSEIASAWYTVDGLTVNEHVVTPGKYNLTLANAFWGTSGTGASAGHTASGKQNDISVSIAGSSGTQNYINDSETRIYGSHTITFSVPSGYVLKEITGLGTSSKSSIAVATGSTGTITTRVWSGSAQSVTFDVNGRTDFSTVSVTYAADVKYAVSFSAPIGGTLSIKDGDDAISSGDTFSEDKELTVTATPTAATHHGGTVKVVKTGVTPEADVTSTVYNAGTGKLTMPDYAITVSATFVADAAISVAVADGQSSWGSVKLYNSTPAEVSSGTTFKPSAEFIIEATPESGYVFDHWTKSDGSDITLSEEDAADANPSLAAGEVSTTFTASFRAASTPNLAVDPASLSFDPIAVNGSQEKKFELMGENLTEDASLAITGTGAAMFSVASPVAKDGDGNILEDVTVTYNPTAAGTHTATLTISSAGAASREVALSGEAKNNYTIIWSVNGTPLTGAALDGVTTSVLDGGSVTDLPANPAGLTCKNTFKGWSKKNGGTTAQAPSYYDDLFTDAEHAPVIEDATTFYAVFGSASVPSTNLFSWEGGTAADLATAAGAEQNVGSDYASSNAPYRVKLDGTGKYILIAVASQPSKVAVDVKMLGGANTSKITVQEAASTDANTFTDVEELTISGSQNDVLNLETTNSFASTTRAIKLYFTKGSNVGVGPISITGVPAPDYVTECAAVEAPTFSPAAGTYNEAKSVALSCATEGEVTIKYTTDGTTEPSKTVGETYNEAIAVNQSMIIKAIAIKGEDVSELATAAYVLQVPTPTISGATAFLESSEVTITCEGADAIYYTTNGDDPTTESTLYNAPFTVDATKTIKAIAIKANWNNSEVAEQAFTKVTPLTVAEARTAIDGGTGLTNRYVKGIISQIDSYNSTYNSITYWISDDGTTTNQLEVYSGLAGVVKDHFEGTTDIKVGEEVIVNGTLKKYGSVYEFDKNNEIVAYRPFSPIAWSADNCTAQLGGSSNAFPTLSGTTGLTITYASSDAAKASFANASVNDITLSAVTGEDPITITATSAANAQYVATSVTYALTITEEEITYYSLSYEKNGGTSDATNSAAETNLPANLPTITKAGYNFGGWYTDEGCTEGKEAVPGAALTENTTLYAQWLDPYTVAQALTMIAALDNDEKTDEVYVAGVVTDDAVSISSSSATYYIKDATEDNSLEVYKGKGLNNTNVAEGDIQEGDQVVVYGQLMKYKGNNSTAKPEIVNPNYIYSRVRPTVNVTGVTLPATAIVRIGSPITLTPTIAPSNATNKNVSWSVISGNTYAEVSDAGVVTGLIAGGDAVIQVETEDGNFTATCTVSVAAARPTFTEDDHEWIKITNASKLVAGKFYVIAESANGKTATTSISSSVMGNVASTFDDGRIASGELGTNTAIFELGGNSTDGWTLYEVTDEENTGYFSGANASSFGWSKNVATTPISFNEDGKAILGDANGYRLLYNTNNGNPRFKTYSSSLSNSMLLPQLYMWAELSHAVTFDANGGVAESVPGVERTDDGKITIPETEPTHSDVAKVFAGWYKSDAPGTLYNAGDEFATNVDVTLYAKWNTVPTYTVTYVPGGSGTVPAVASYPAGKKVLVATDVELSNPGYSFTGWTVKDADQNVLPVDEDNKFTMPAKNVTIVAGWARISNQKWVLVENVDDLKTDGTKYIIAGAEHNVGMGALNGSIYNSVGVTKDGKTLKGPEMTELTFEAGSEGKLAIKHGSKYVYSTSAKSIGERDETFEWTISISEGVATINAGSAGTLQYNSGNPRFTTYTSTQQPVAIYIKSESVVVSGNQNISGITAGSDVTVENGGVLTVNEDKSIGDLTVENGGKVVLSGNKLTVVGTFSIESTMAGGSSGQLTGATGSNFAASDEAYIDITLGAGATADQWHAFTVPFPVDAINGVFDLDGNKLNNEEHYAIMSYHGDVRATGAYGWKKYRDVMVPGTFYLMTVDGLRTTFRFKKKAGSPIVAAATKALTAYSGAGATNDQGWNGVGNPTLRYGTVNQKAQVLDPVSYTYVPYLVGNMNFVVGTPFFVQVESDGTMEMGAIDGGKPYYAPAREEANEIKDIEVAFGNEDFSDRLYISASEEALNKYQIGKDLVKMTMTSAPKVAQIFGNAYNSKLCMVYAPMSNDKAEYALSLYAPANGEYTIAAQQVENAEVYLTKDGSIIWNISESAYTAEFTKGSTENYGLLMIKKTPQVTTGIDGVESSKAAQKLIIDQNVFILRGEKMYDVTGKEVK